MIAIEPRIKTTRVAVEAESAPRVAQKPDPDQIVLESTSSGIQVTEGGQTLGLLHGRARSVDTFASGMAMRARYVDADTGNVTINNVYVQ